MTAFSGRPSESGGLLSDAASGVAVAEASLIPIECGTLAGSSKHKRTSSES